MKVRMSSHTLLKFMFQADVPKRRSVAMPSARCTAGPVLLLLLSLSVFSPRAREAFSSHWASPLLVLCRTSLTKWSYFTTAAQNDASFFERIGTIIYAWQDDVIFWVWKFSISSDTEKIGMFFMYKRTDVLKIEADIT